MECNELWRKARAMGIPRHVLIGTLTTDARVPVEGLSHKFNPTEKGQLAEKKATPFKNAP